MFWVFLNQSILKKILRIRGCNFESCLKAKAAKLPDNTNGLK